MSCWGHSRRRAAVESRLCCQIAPPPLLCSHSLCPSAAPLFPPAAPLSPIPVPVLPLPPNSTSVHDGATAACQPGSSGETIRAKSTQSHNASGAPQLPPPLPLLGGMKANVATSASNVRSGGSCGRCASRTAICLTGARAGGRQGWGGQCVQAGTDPRRKQAGRQAGGQATTTDTPAARQLPHAPPHLEAAAHRPAAGLQVGAAAGAWSGAGMGAGRWLDGALRCGHPCHWGPPNPPWRGERVAHL